MIYKSIFVLTFGLAAFAIPATASFVRPDVPIILATPDATGRFEISEGILYQLPFPVAFEAGDVIMLEPGSTSVISDLVRFFPNLQDFGNGTGIGNEIFMFSEIEANDPDPRDLGIPTDRSLNLVTLTESGPENTLQAVPYSASLADGSRINYVFISDIPEPSSLFLFGSGALFLGGALRRKSKTHS